MATNPIIKPRRGTNTPGVGVIVQNELAVDTTNKRIFIGAADGSGTLIGAAPGGSDTYVQFNDSGNLGGDSGLTYNKTTDALTITGDVAVNGGDITTTAVTATVFDTNATTVTAFRSATTLTLGATSGTSQIRNDTTIGGDLTITGGDLFTSAATSTLMNTTATNLSIGGAATTLTLGATSGTTAIRNAETKLGNTIAELTTNSGTANSLTINPYGSLILSPLTTAISAGGTNANLTITNTNDGVGTVAVTGGDLVLGTKNTDEFTASAVNIIFEGATDNAFDTTLTVTDPTANRTITLPNATGTVALIAGSDTHVLFNDGGVVGGDSGLTYNKTTDALTVTGDLAVNGGDITSSAVTFNLLNATVTTMNLGGASTAITMGDSTTATTTIRGGTLVGNTATQNLFNTTATTFNLGGAATAITMGDATTATTTVRGGTLVGNATTQNLFNTTATTINLGGAATTINLGPTGGTGAIDVNRNTIQEATLKFYNETTSAPAISAGTLTLDLSAAQVFTVSLNANVTTLTISNTPATASRSIGFTLILTADGTARTVTWGAAVLWPAGTSPTLTSTNGKKDVFSLVTTDGGTTWLAFAGGQNF